jgi:formamidopyrimidine-DNA glycosylase
MPELPEVERFRLYLDETSLHQTISDVLTPDTKGVTRFVPHLAEVLKGRTFASTERLGKNLIIHLDNKSPFIMHFGMTGHLHYQERYDKTDLPDYTRVIFRFAKGGALIFADLRKFGRLYLPESVAAYQAEKDLGPDALAMSEPDFIALLRKRKGLIKPVLMNQKNLAGIGNWIADEMLWQAFINPAQALVEVSDKQLAALHKALHWVLQEAIKHGARYEKMPKLMLVHVRHYQEDTDPQDIKSGTPTYSKDKASLCPRHRTPLTISEVGGRTTYWCPTCQPKE